MRRAAKKDDNHNEITDALIKLGFSVADTSGVGNGFPDIVVANKNKTVLVEIKSAKGKLEPDQIEFKKHWRGEYVVATHYAQVLRAFGIDVI